MAMPTKTFTPNVPQAAQRISDTQTPINDNFQAITELIGEDHIDFNTNNFGRHKWVRFEALVAPGAFDATELGVYNQIYPTTAVNELYVHKLISGGTAEIPFTASKMSASTYPNCTNGWSYLPSGLLIKWGAQQANAATIAVTPTVLSGGPNFSRVFTVLVTAFSSLGSYSFPCGQYSAANNTSGNFNAYCNNYAAANTSIRYLVIGV